MTKKVLRCAILNRIGVANCRRIVDMNFSHTDFAGMDIEETQVKLNVLMTCLMSIAEADRVYWRKKEHSREDASEYQRRQDRVNEIRLEIMTLAPFTVQ
jgi:hypothetical protein